MKNSRRVYADLVLESMPRILSSMDRNRHSDTFGCLDRAYWQYKSTDFSCSRFQEPCLTLALLYLNDFDGNLYYRNRKNLDWCIASMLYLTKVQNPDGSFNEWYPNERSFIGTAFPIYAVSETFKILRDEISEKDREDIYQSIVKAGKWLMKNDRTEVANQEAGAIASLYNIYLITGEPTYKDDVIRKIRLLAEKRTGEGWFPEYGGPDIGYLTVLIDFLAKYYRESRDNKIIELLNPSISFIKYFIHPDGTLGGEYASRNTEFKYPHGFEILSKENATARAIADKIAKHARSVLNPLALDDRFAMCALSSYLQAFLDHVPDSNEKVQLPYKNRFVKFFKISKLFVTGKQKYYLVIGGSKGGVFKLFLLNENKKLLYSDCGFIGKIKDGTTVTNQWLNPDINFSCNDDEIVIKGVFKKIITQQTLTPKDNLFLRSFLITAGRSNKVASFVKKKLIKKLIIGTDDVGIEFERKIKLYPEKIYVTDIIRKDQKVEFEELHIGSKFSVSYVPTSKFFQLPELYLPEQYDTNYAKKINKHSEVEIKRRIDIK